MATTNTRISPRAKRPPRRWRAQFTGARGETRRFSAVTQADLYARVVRGCIEPYLAQDVRAEIAAEITQLIAAEQWEGAASVYFEANEKEGLEVWTADGADVREPLSDGRV